MKTVAILWKSLKMCSLYDVTIWLSLYNLLYSLSVPIHSSIRTHKLFVDLISLKVCEMCFYQYVPLLPTPLALRSTAVP